MNIEAKIEKSVDKLETKHEDKNPIGEKKRVSKENNGLNPQKSIKGKQLKGGVVNKSYEKGKKAGTKLKELPKATSLLESGRKELKEPLAQLTGHENGLHGSSGLLKGSVKQLSTENIADTKMGSQPSDATEESITSAQQLSNAIKQLKNGRKELPGSSGLLKGSVKQLSTENIADTKMGSQPSDATEESITSAQQLSNAIKQLKNGRKELPGSSGLLKGSVKQLSTENIADTKMGSQPSDATEESITSAQQLSNAIKQLKNGRKELPGRSGLLKGSVKQLSTENIADTKMGSQLFADLNSITNSRKQQPVDNIRKKEYLNPGLLSVGEDVDTSLQVAIKSFKISTNENVIVSKELLEYKQTKWKDVGLSPTLINVLLSLGYDFPSPVQYQCIPSIINGKDVLVRAKNGSGKSLSFLIPIIQRIDPLEQSLQAVVVAPTRELALQIARFARSLCKDLGIKSCPLIGGSNITDDMIRVSSGVQLLIGAPGRLYSVLSRKMCTVGNNPLIVFDEADKLLDSVFYEQISKFLEILPRKRQMCLFSATFPQSAKTFINTNMKTPEYIKISNEYTLFNIEQFYCFVNMVTKLPCLQSLLAALDINQCIIYVNAIKNCQPLAKKITEMGYSCYFIHSKLSQDERNLILHNFSKNRTKILVSSDITTRGTDVQGVNVVINFDLPKSSESYLHRLGRAGRFGTRGCCISMIKEDEMQTIQSYATFVGAPIIACKGGELKKFCKD
ncbi:DExD/H-box ATP-dependent RNA helicase dhh1 [Glugoides intestinalis]